MVTAAQLRQLALGLPGAQERETWGHPRSGSATRSSPTVYEGDAGAIATVKASPEDQER